MIRFMNKYVSFDVIIICNMFNVKIDNFVRNLIESKGVNVYVWRGLCCFKVNSLRKYFFFFVLLKESLFCYIINFGFLGIWYG